MSPRHLWMLAYAVATFLSFPHPLAFLDGRVLDAGVVVSFAVPACLVLGLADRGPRAAAASAFAWTLLGHGLVLHFIYVVTVVYGHAPRPVGVLAPFALASYAGVLGAAFGAVWAWLRGRGLANPWSAALLWTALDHLRSFFLTGWPWATLGYAQHLNPALMGLPQWTGVYGLSFVVVLGGVAAASAIAAWRRGERPGRGTVTALVTVVLLHGLGLAIRAAPGDDALGPTIRMAVVQGNIDQGVKWDAAWIERTLRTYEELTRRAASDGARIVAWPETAVPGALELDPGLRARIAALARDTGSLLIVGGVGVDVAPTGRVERFYDSAFFVDPARGFLPGRYDKTHLVPFGEYVPLRDLLGHFLGAVASGIARGDVTPGAAPRAVDLRLADAPDGVPRVVRLGVPICYELLFPDLVRRFVNDGAGILVGITNDAWYGRTGAPYQFLAITAMRSAETGVFGVRAANTGISAVIDSGGWVRQQTPIFEEALRVADVPVRSPEEAAGATFYVRHGDVFAGACWIGIGVALAAGGWRGRGPRLQAGEAPAERGGRRRRGEA